MNNLQNVVIIIILTVLAAIGISGLCHAEYTPAPETLTINSPEPLVCINGWVSDNQAHYIEKAAWELGFATYWAEKNQTITDCDVYFIRGDADTWLKNGKTYTFKGMSKAKCHRVLLGWKLAQQVTAQCRLLVNGQWTDCLTGKVVTPEQIKAESYVYQLYQEWCSGKASQADMERALVLDGFEYGHELPSPGNVTQADIARIVEGVWGACSEAK